MRLSAAAAIGESLAGRRLDVFPLDAALVAGTLHPTEIHTQFARAFAHTGTGIGEPERDLVDCAGWRGGRCGFRRGRRGRRRGRRRAVCRNRHAPAR